MTKVCIISDCSKKKFTRNLCKTHYSKFRRDGSLENYPTTTQSSCSVDGCQKAHEARGFCSLHYQRFKVHGDINTLYPNAQQRCSFDGCEIKHTARGYCQKHYQRWKIYGDPSISWPDIYANQVARFWEKIEKKDGCWRWLASTSGDGYGLHANTKAHRFSWRVHFGDIPDGLHVCHRCDNPWCTNPDHLFLGTHRDNMRDMANKERNCKLSREDVRTIREMYRPGQGSVLSSIFGVSQAMITSIASGKFRSDVT